MLSSLAKKPFATCLKGARISLVRPNQSHTRSVWAYIQRDHQLGGGNYKWIESEQAVAKYITNESLEEAAEVSYLIMKNEAAIGSFHIHSINYADHKAEIGYGIEKGEEGNGYVSEAFQLVEQEMIRLGFNKLVINCDTKNLRSTQLAERNGFRLEGTLVEDCIIEGAFRDSLVFGKLIRGRS